MTEQEARRIIDPGKELLRWGPIQGRFFFMSEFCEALFFRIADRFPGNQWPNALCLTKKGSFLWLDPMDDMRRDGSRIFREYILPEEKRISLYRSWEKKVGELVDFEHGMTDISSLTDEAFKKLWDDFYALTTEFWIDTIPAELGNYGSDRLLEDALRSQVPANEMSSVLEVLTAPERPSFYQEEEIALSETTDIAVHQRSYFWLKNSYAGAQVMPVAFFEERKREIPSDIRAQIDQRFQVVRKKKRDVIERLHISDEAVRIAEALRTAIEWQDERKKYIFETIHYKDLLLREAARRFGYEADILFDYGSTEIRTSAFSKEFGADYRNRSIASVHSYWHENGKTHSRNETVTEATLDVIWNVYTHEHVEENISEFKGIAACVGNGKPVRGQVRIMLDPRESGVFKPGEVLVTSMTTPEYVFVMKEAVAILTDTGGLTSHAAIVSRELNVPCLVGTKIATKTLKNGDEVEVDADKGIIRIIKRV